MPAKKSGKQGKKEKKMWYFTQLLPFVRTFFRACSLGADQAVPFMNSSELNPELTGEHQSIPAWTTSAPPTTPHKRKKRYSWWWVAKWLALPPCSKKVSEFESRLFCESGWLSVFVLALRLAGNLFGRNPASRPLDYRLHHRLQQTPATQTWIRQV